MTMAPTTTDRLRAGRQPPHPARVRALTLLSGVGLGGLVTAVALRQPPAIAVPPGLVAAVACFAARSHLRRQADSGQPVSDRSYAVAYPILAHGVLVGLFAAFVVVHEASRTISESAIHAAYWAAMGTIWLLPATVQAWQASHPPEDPPAGPDSGANRSRPRVGMFERRRWGRHSSFNGEPMTGCGDGARCGGRDAGRPARSCDRTATQRDPDAATAGDETDAKEAA